MKVLLYVFGGFVFWFSRGENDTSLHKAHAYHGQLFLLELVHSETSNNNKRDTDVISHFPPAFVYHLRSGQFGAIQMQVVQLPPPPPSLPAA